MPRRTHYSPCIDRVIVCALYHEGRRLRRPMTRLVNDLLTSSLQHTQMANNLMSLFRHFWAQQLQPGYFGDAAILLLCK